ncbi:MAG: putative enzyme related to lactoylglutathione lyase [Bacteroidia bacterium]|jgi:predicted enzyme related to lactoylglutathione lyase
MTNNHINYIEFKTKDVEATKGFYTKAFDWTFTDYGPTYVAFEESGLHGGFELTKKSIKKGALVVLYHEDLKAIKKRVKKSGGKITKPIFAFPGGHRFHFQDPSGNELAIWSDKEY